jgi:hypothetical protein
MIKKAVLALTLSLFCNESHATPGQYLTKKYYDIETKRMNDQVTVGDRLFMKSTYRTMAAGGLIVYPEAGMVLNRCLNDNANDLRLPSRYFKRSPHVRSSLKNKKSGTYGPFYFKQSADQRLSYTFNGYYITIADMPDDKKKIKVHQLIDFSHNTTRHKRPLNERGVSTKFSLGEYFTFRMADTLIFVASDCSPFIAYAEWIE